MSNWQHGVSNAWHGYAMRKRLVSDGGALHRRAKSQLTIKRSEIGLSMLDRVAAKDGCGKGSPPEHSLSRRNWMP